MRCRTNRHPTELIKAVADFLRNEIAPADQGPQRLQAARRHQRARSGDAATDAGGGERCGGSGAAVSSCSARQGSLVELNRALSDSIAKGEVDLQTPGLAEHLWQTTMDKLAVDQPNYASYKRELGAKIQLASRHPEDVDSRGHHASKRCDICDVKRCAVLAFAGHRIASLRSQ